MTWEKETKEVQERGGIMPNTALPGYIYEWEDRENLSDEQNARIHEWWVEEINNVLPDYATWHESTSEIVLPINNVDDFDERVNWDEVLATVHERYLEKEDEIIGE